MVGAQVRDTEEDLGLGVLEGLKLSRVAPTAFPVLEMALNSVLLRKKGRGGGREVKQGLMYPDLRLITDVEDNFVRQILLPPPAQCK